MFDFYKRKEKRRIIAISSILLVALVFSNFVSTNDYDKLEQNMSSIYKDRLMPAYYLFQINDHLYQKKILLNNAMQNKLAADIVTGNLHNHAIDSLISAYSLTYLTTEEKKEWNSFLLKLKNYNTAEANALNSKQQFELSDDLFTEVQHSLNNLSRIQASVGKQLHSSTKTIVYGSVIYTYLQVALMIILILIVLMTLRSSDYVLSGSKYPQSLN